MGRPISALGLLLALLPFSMATGGNPLIVQAQNQHCGSAPCPHRGALATSLTVSLHGSGAHRRLEYRLAVRCPEAEGAAAGEGATRATAAAECAAAVALLQSLPPVIYADIYELDNEAAAGRGPAVNLFGTVDVESIERYAEAMVLAVYASGGNGSAADQQQAGAACGETVLTVPLHARYPHPRYPQQQQQEPGEGWLTSGLSAVAVAELLPPMVLVQCSAEWQAADVQAAPAAVRWEIPAGNLRHGPVVAAATASAVGCGVTAVLWALLRPLPVRKQGAAMRRKQQ